MKLIAVNRFIGSNWYRRPRKRPLVGPTGSPFLDVLVMQTRACRWFRKNKSVNPLKRVTFRKYDHQNLPQRMNRDCENARLEFLEFSQPVATVKCRNSIYLKTKLSGFFSHRNLIIFLNIFTGDEAIISMSVAGEVADASIMEIGRSRPQFQYSRVNINMFCKCWNS